MFPLRGYICDLTSNRNFGVGRFNFQNMNIIKFLIRAISIRKKHPKEIKNPFEESNKLIDNAKESYFKIMEEDESVIIESPNSSESNL